MRSIIQVAVVTILVALIGYQYDWSPFECFIATFVVYGTCLLDRIGDLLEEE